MRRSIPPITMRDVWREQSRSKIGINSGLGDLGGLVNKVKELDSRINISGGRGFAYGSMGSINRRGTNRERTSDGFDVSKYVKKPRQKLRIAIVQYEPKIECIRQEIMENYDGNGNLAVFSEFRGFNSKGSFTRSRNSYGQNPPVYYMPGSYNGNKEARLRLSTNGDILEYEVVSQKNGNDRLFDKEIFLPKHVPEFLKVYDPLSMGVAQRSKMIVVSYEKINKV